ncbi:unnamed protein product [Psylliodes chrysocephalus]|uniref:Uncharacterized protein n=1 Tax=Psylliodes chrysocephalus TaxID=3402493 RepID=A0A9P0CJ79_9CUCU|nr:unnamed protein product [Psylliodes chrysocephala]
MYQEMFCLARGIEAIRLLEIDSQDETAFQRSSVSRRRVNSQQRPIFKRGQSARRNFEKCIERCGIIEENVNDVRNNYLKEYWKCLNQLKMMKIDRKKINRNVDYKQMKTKVLKDKNDSVNNVKDKTVPWVLRWRHRRIHPVCDIR